jgi:hypothetical protein
MNLVRLAAVALGVATVATSLATAATGSDVQARVDADLAKGQPVVVHVVVALCDNANQGIVPVPTALGNGQDPRTNLYWGALYGVRTHLAGSAGWTRLELARPADSRILERIVLYSEIERNQRSAPVYVIADAWDGVSIREAMRAFLEMAAGQSVETVAVGQRSDSRVLQAGGGSHVVAYVGHNGLMDFDLQAPAPISGDANARSAIALACASKRYIVGHLRSAGAHPLLLTTGLMAPEAYTLDSAIRAWVSEGTTAAVIDGAAGAYDRYQKCGTRAARRLFWGEP